MKNQFLKFFGLILLLSFTSNVFAQKLKNERIEVSYRQLPQTPLDNEFTTFKAHVSGASYAYGNSLLEANGTTLSDLTKAVSISGFKRVTGNAHVRINVSVGNMVIVKTKVEKETKKSKSKDGKVTTKTYYFHVFEYYVPVRYTVYDYKGNLLKEGRYATSKTKTGTKGTSYSKVLAQWRKGRNKIAMTEGSSYIRNAVNSITSSINKLYGYPLKTYRDDIKVPKKNDDFMKAYSAVKIAFANAKGDEKVETLAADAKPGIDFWMGYDQFSAKDRKKKKLRYACLYNLSKTYYWMDDMANAEKYAKEAIAIGWKDNFLTRFLKDINGVKKSLEVNGVDSRRFAIDLESAVGPKSNAEIAAIAAEEANNTKLDGKLILSDGEEIEGEFKINTEEANTLAFGPKGNISFVHQAEGKDQTKSLKPEDIKSFSFNSRSFLVMDFAPGAKGNKEVGKHILEVLYDSPRIKLLKYYPYDNQLGDKKVEFAFMKTGDTAPTSTSSSAFLIFKRGLAKYFVECADLAEIAGAGDIAHTEEGLMQAARIYAEVCE